MHVLERHDPTPILEGDLQDPHQVENDAIEFEQKAWVTAYGITRERERSAKGDLEFVPPKPPWTVRDDFVYTVLDDAYARQLAHARRAHDRVALQNALSDVALDAATLAEGPNVAESRDSLRRNASPATHRTSKSSNDRAPAGAPFLSTDRRTCQRLARLLAERRGELRVLVPRRCGDIALT